MIVQFTVGEKEKHAVEVICSTWTGQETVSVDNKDIINKHSSFKTAETLRFTVGTEEKHDVEVRISGWWATKVEAIVDGVVVVTSVQRPVRG